MGALGYGALGFPLSDQSQERPRKPGDYTMYYLLQGSSSEKTEPFPKTYFFMANKLIKQALPLEKPLPVQVRKSITCKF